MLARDFPVSRFTIDLDLAGQLETTDAKRADKPFMAKGKHHFVPRFYLDAFQSAPRRINVYNLKAPLAVRDASLKNQCYRRRFYGQTDDIEDGLAILESHAAPVLQSIRTQRRLPAEGTEEYLTLLAFAALQVLRTTVVADRTNVRVDKMMKQVYSGDPRLAEADLETVKFGYEDPALASLRNLPRMLDAVSDLSGHLVVSPSDGFLTSDNPAFKYNQYCEEIQHMGITGALSRGLQIFLPLAPDLQLLLYDGTTYQVRLSNRLSRRSVATTADTDAMNAMQLISADQHIYFSDWRQAEEIRRLLPRVADRRAADPTVVVEYGQDDDPNSSLLHTFERTPCLGLNPSFMSVRRGARRVPLADRGLDYRKDVPMSSGPEPPHLRGRSVTFSRFIGRR